MHHDIQVYGGIKLYAGTASPELAGKVAAYLGEPVREHEVVEFPNENIFVKLHESVRGQDVYLIQTTSSPVHRNLMELRVPISARLVADMLEVAGADRYVTFDPHAGQIQGFFSIPGDVITCFHMITEYICTEIQPNMVDPVVVSVDLGFAKKGRNVAAALDVPIAFIEKRRGGNDSSAEALSIIGDVQGRDVILVDDEIDTGGSITQAVNLVKSRGAREVYVVCVHALFSRDAAERLAALPVRQYIVTDTVPLPQEKLAHLGERIKILSIATLLGEVILRAHEGRSVGELFHE
jgi:ribose-phosphate pyrophosphokinase